MTSHEWQPVADRRPQRTPRRKRRGGNAKPDGRAPVAKRQYSQAVPRRTRSFGSGLWNFVKKVSVVLRVTFAILVLAVGFLTWKGDLWLIHVRRPSTNGSPPPPNVPEDGSQPRDALHPDDVIREQQRIELEVSRLVAGLKTEPAMKNDDRQELVVMRLTLGIDGLFDSLPTMLERHGYELTPQWRRRVDDLSARWKQLETHIGRIGRNLKETLTP